MLVNYIKTKGLHRYMIDGNHSGCLFWTRSLILCMQKDGILAADSVARMDREVQLCREELAHIYRIPDDCGICYDQGEIPAIPM